MKIFKHLYTPCVICRINYTIIPTHDTAEHSFLFSHIREACSVVLCSDPAAELNYILTCCPLSSWADMHLGLVYAL